MIREKQNVNTSCKTGKHYIQFSIGIEPRSLYYETDILIHCATMTIWLLLGGNILFWSHPNTEQYDKPLKKGAINRYGMPANLSTGVL